MGTRYVTQGAVGCCPRCSGSCRPRSTSWLRTTCRRTCARLCHLAGGELDQIQFLLGHVSIQTTERYLGCKQKLRIAVNDRLGIEPDAP
jgi:integrase